MAAPRASSLTGLPERSERLLHDRGRAGIAHVGVGNVRRTREAA